MNMLELIDHALIHVLNYTTVYTVTAVDTPILEKYCTLITTTHHNDTLSFEYLGIETWIRGYDTPMQ